MPKSRGRAPFPIPDAPPPIGRARSSRCSPPWAAGPLALGLRNLDFACPSDMQVMPALSLG